MSDVTLSLLVDALSSDALSLGLRPVVTATEHKVAAFEGVLHSDHEAMGDPSKVVQAAAEYNMVDELAERVADLAQAWLSRLPGRVDLVLDLLPFEVVEPDRVMGRLARVTSQPGRLIVRLPHPGLILDMPNCAETLRRIREAGHKVAISGAAGGFRVLGFAMRPPPQIVELEHGFITGIDEDEDRGRILDHILKFAHDRDVAVLAQGVRTPAEADALASRGVDLLAGELFDVEYGP